MRKIAIVIAAFLGFAGGARAEGLACYRINPPRVIYDGVYDLLALDGTRRFSDAILLQFQKFNEIRTEFGPELGGEGFTVDSRGKNVRFGPNGPSSQPPYFLLFRSNMENYQDSILVGDDWTYFIDGSNSQYGLERLNDHLCSYR